MMLGAAMATIVWSMKVIDTAKSIAARDSVWWAAPCPAGGSGSGTPVVGMVRVSAARGHRARQARPAGRRYLRPS